MVKKATRKKKSTGLEPAMTVPGKFSFEISLSVLNHLGRNLYRSFSTILGEAISNSWDADAKNVWIDIDTKTDIMIIKDDGNGMTSTDFQSKFLKVGYSKRKGGDGSSPGGRPFIGRKGIGKLALLSCADRITIVSKTKKTDYIGGTIENSGLDKAITDDLTPQEYPLQELDLKEFGKYTKYQRQGTIIRFQNIKGGIKNSVDLLRKTIALYFRFSLVDPTFNIYVNGKKIGNPDMKDLASKTQFLWTLNTIVDPFVQLLKPVESAKVAFDRRIYGFIGSVSKPRDLNIMNMEERVTVDLFVNGRLREKDILKHIPSARIVEDYLYGQIHLDFLDDMEKDRFTSNREGVVADDAMYQDFLKNFKTKVMTKVIENWDVWRRKHKQDGDPENLILSSKDRKSQELFNLVAKEFTLPKSSKNRDRVEGWINELAGDAQFNFGSYAECFIAENLVRKFILHKKHPLTIEAKKEVEQWKKKEKENKEKANISIRIRKIDSDLSYLSMDGLSNLIDKKDKLSAASLSRDAGEYKPIRDALAHTALLTDQAKKRLSTVYENIKERIKTIVK